MALVKITQEAIDADSRMQEILNGSLLENINTLGNLGQTLSDPTFWEGRYASEFRAQWPEYEKQLKAAQQALQELQQSAEQIHRNIIEAGGGA